jgi:hypothetical protein
LEREMSETTELFYAGDDIPRTWFADVEGLKEARFTHPCIVQTTDSRRTIRAATPQLGAPLMVFHPTEQGGHIQIEFDRETLVLAHEANPASPSPA